MLKTAFDKLLFGVFAILVTIAPIVAVADVDLTLVGSNKATSSVDKVVPKEDNSTSSIILSNSQDDLQSKGQNDQSDKLQNFAKNNAIYDTPKELELNKVSRKKQQYNINIAIKDQKDALQTKIYNGLHSAFNALNENRLEAAIYYYKNVLSREPKNKQALFGLGVVYQLLYQDTQAIDVYSKMLSYQYADEKVINNLIIALSNKEENNEALDILLKINKITPNNPVILGQIGSLYLKNKDYERSIPYLNSAMALTVSNVLFAYNLALAYDSLNNYEDARYYYQFALQNNISTQMGSESVVKIKTRVQQLNDLIEKKSDTA